MNNTKLLEAVKTGLMGELDSINLYKKAEDIAEGEVKEFFKSRVAEEKTHYNYLLQYLNEIKEGMNLSSLASELSKDHALSPIISADFIQRIAGNQILFSSISTALLLEKNAADFYKKTAELTTEKEIKEFFNELVKWEQQHYDDLLKIQKESELVYWEINKFEPF